MSEKENKEIEETSFIAFFSRLFGKKKVQYLKVKKKKKKEFVAVDGKKDIIDDKKDKEDKEVKEENLIKKDFSFKIRTSKAKSVNSQEKEVDEKHKLDDKKAEKSKLEVKEKVVAKSDEKSDEKKDKERITFDDLTEEEKELYLQKKILLYFEEYLKDREYLLKSYMNEYEKYDKENEEALLLDEVKETSDKVDLLIEKINLLKREILDLEKNIVNGDFNVDDNYVKALIEEYKHEFSKEFDLTKYDLDDKDNKYKPLLVKIEEIDYVVNKVSDSLKEKAGKYDERDKDFEKFRKEYYQNDDLFDSIKLMIKENDYLLSEIEEKVANSRQVFTEVEVVYRRVNNNLSSALFMYAMVRRNPLVPNIVKSAVCTNMMIQGFRALLTPFRAERRVRTMVEIHDYEKEIIDGLKSMDDVFKLIDNTMQTVVDLKKEFEDNFKEYDIPEYKEIMDKLYDLSKNLTDSREYLVNSKDKFSEELEKNKVKIKELNYDSYDEELNEVEDTN